MLARKGSPAHHGRVARQRTVGEGILTTFAALAYRRDTDRA
jgi:hypothetical protein